jgi:tetratricopeptide (TPR) repeat protein
MENSAPTLDGLFARLIEALEGDPDFDLEGFLRAHAEHGARLRQRVENLRRAGLLGPGAGAGQVLHTMRARFGVTSSVRTVAPAPAEPATPGELLPSRLVGGRYRILDEIGRGGMGRVFRALDVDLGREVALKVVDLEPGAGAEARERRAYLERFLSEAQVTAQLEHPAIVPLHDIGIDRTGQLYYTMKRVEGRTLESWIAEWRAGPGRPRVPLPELLRIVLQICDALALAHARGVVHRDLKPSNVMIGRFGEVHVMDWGLAKLLGRDEPAAPGEGRVCERADSPTRLGQVLGTPTHMAPEQARGDPGLIDARADIYGVGAILCHALTGEPPNRKASGAAAWTGVPAELAAVCRKALEPERERRYPSAAELAADLRAFLEMRRGSAWRDGPWRSTVKLVRRRAASVAGLGAALLAVIAALTIALYAQQRERAEESETRANLLASLLDTEKALVAEEQKRVAAEQARADAQRERAELGNLVSRLLVQQQHWAADELSQRDAPELPSVCEQTVAEFRAVGLALDGEEPVGYVLARLAKLRELAPEVHARVVQQIADLAHQVERPQLYSVMLFCEGRFPRTVSEKRRPTWEQYCREHSELLRFLPRLDELVDGIVTDPWRREVWRAYRARRREVTPWPAALLAETPEDPEDVLFLGSMLAGDPDRKVELRAAQLMELAAHHLPDEYWPQFLLGFWKAETLPEIVDLEQAIEHDYRAVAIQPDSYSALANLGHALLRANRNTEALHALERAARLAPDDAMSHGNLGEALRCLGRLDEALQAQDRSIALDSTRSRPYLNRSLVHSQLGDHAAAERDLRRALELEPGYVKAWIRLGTVLEQQGQIDEALQELDRGLELLPHSTDLNTERDRLLDGVEEQ